MDVYEDDLTGEVEELNEANTRMPECARDIIFVVSDAHTRDLSGQWEVGTLEWIIDEVSLLRRIDECQPILELEIMSHILELRKLHILKETKVRGVFEMTDVVHEHMDMDNFAICYCHRTANALNALGLAA